MVYIIQKHCIESTGFSLKDFVAALLHLTDYKYVYICIILYKIQPDTKNLSTIVLVLYLFAGQ